MTDAGQTLYDAVAYPGLSYEYTHPDRLATVAVLHGLESAPPTHCRVLELGCSSGTNIIPMAFQYPGSEFVGLDLSEKSVAVGVGNIAEWGLSNVTLRAANIMDVDGAYGRFDYIIAHGVYSWVPPFVREKVLSICRENLAPTGVAYLSYNSLPGSYLRNLTRDIMLHHVEGIADPRERVAQARGVLKFVADASAADSVYGTVLRDQFDRVKKMRDEILLYDDLEEEHTPFLLRQVVKDARRHGLQYLSDATFARSDLQQHPAEVVEVIDRLCGDDIVARHQYQDFIEGHGFRRTLLCHGEVSLQRSPEPTCVKRFLLATSAKPADAGVDPATNDVVAFKTQNGATLSTDHPLSKAALLHLGENWPQRVSFPELLLRATQRLGPAAGRRVGEEDDMADLLLRAAHTGHVNLHIDPPPLTITVSERPQASPLARKQMATSSMVTNQQHRAVLLDGETFRCFLPLVDGTRTVDALVIDLKDVLKIARASGQGGDGGQDEVTRESVENALKMLAGMALLVA